MAQMSQQGDALTKRHAFVCQKWTEWSHHVWEENVCRKHTSVLVRRFECFAQKGARYVGRTFQKIFFWFGKTKISSIIWSCWVLKCCCCLGIIQLRLFCVVKISGKQQCFKQIHRRLRKVAIFCRPTGKPHSVGSRFSNKTFIRMAHMLISNRQTIPSLITVIFSVIFTDVFVLNLQK